MLRNFHKITSERWQRTPEAPRKAAHFLLKEVGQNIKDKKRDKRVRDGVPFCRGSREGDDFKQQDTLSQQETLWGVLESQRAT